MKRQLLSFFLLLLLTLSAAAQETDANRLMNTLKERISLAGYTQLAYTYTDAGNSFELRKAILIANGKITDRWSAFFMYSLANRPKVLEAYTEYRFAPQLRVRLGQFKTPYSIESPLSPCVLELVNGTAQAVSYLAGINGSDPLYGAATGRDIGLMLHGELPEKWAEYRLAVMNGQGINRRDGNRRKDIAGGVTVHPCKWLSVAASFIEGEGCAVATSPVVPDISVGESYTRRRWAVGAVIKAGPASLRTEYLAGKDGSVKSDGYYATTSLHVLRKLDVVASYDRFNPNKTLGSRQTNYVAGLQWWFYPQCRLQAQYTHCVPRTEERFSLLQAQVQVRF